MTKHEINERLSFLAALQQKLTSLALTEDEQTALEELLVAQSGREASEWRHERAEEAVSHLFPTWRGGRIEKPKHPMWHEKSWWWNGASIESLAEQANGDVVVDLSSYVGCGETDNIHGLRIPREWLEADDMGPLIRAHMEAEFSRKEAQRRHQELARAQSELAAAQARLNDMKGA